MKAVYGSIFGTFNNAVITDVKFEDVEFVVEVGYDLISKVYIAPLCVNMTNSTISNVSVTASYSYSKLPDNFDLNNLIIVNEDHIIKKDESSVENIELEISKGEN